MEKELNAAKKINKAAIVIIILMLILMGIMAVNMRHLAERYKGLELRYEELCGEIDGIYEVQNDDKDN